MCTYLQPFHGTYYFRRGVPGDIQHLFPTTSGKARTEWRWSLRVKDREAAKRKLPECIAKTNAWIDNARKALVDAQEEVPRFPTDQQAATAHANVEQIERSSLEAAEHFARQDAEDEFQAETDPAFFDELELRAAKARELARLRTVEEDRELLEQRRMERQLPLTELFERWAEVPGRHLKTVAQWRPYIRQLAEFIGNDNVHAVTHQMLVTWRNHLRDKATYRGKRLSGKTINGSYLGAVGALFAWAKGDGLIDRNPMAEVTKVQLPKRPKLREKEFTLQEARLILRATTSQPPSGEGEALRSAKRWVPWLLAYSGARVNEVTQLRKEDIFEVEGVTVMRLTPEAGTIKAKSFRLVPLHPDIISQGFLGFVAKQADGPLFYDPGKRRSTKAINRQPNRLGSKLAEWVRSLGITDEGVKPNHAWRHLFNSLALRHGIDPRAARVLLGHAPGDAHEDYGTAHVDVLADQVRKLPLFLSTT